MKKNNIEVETYVFVGDEYSDEAYRLENGKRKEKYTKSQIIKTLKSHSEHIMNGTKLKSPIDSETQSYLIEYGNDKDTPKEIIKIVTKKDAEFSTDPYISALDQICKNSINVRMKETAKKVLATVSAVLVTAGVVATTVWGINEGSKEITERDMDYISDINSERAEKGLPPLGGETSADSLEDVEFDYDGHQRSR